MLSKFYDLLMKEGLLIIIAPNRFYYISLLSMMLPDFLKNFAWKMIRGTGQMPFKAYFRLCTKKALLREAAILGFRNIEFFSFDAPPIWFLKFPPFFIMMSYLMLLVNRFRIFENIRSTFIAVFKKA